MSFQIPGYDSNSFKLFSKCARNHAASKKPVMATHCRKKTFCNKQLQKKKQKLTICTFDMTESRVQRQKKYKKENTPAVGQYNPKVQSKPKLTWNILKVYHSQKKMKTQRENVRVSNKISFHSIATEGVKDQDQVIENNQLEISPPHKEQRFQKQENQDKKLKSEESVINRYHTVKSQVNMSRMTGRSNKNCLLISGQSITSINTDLNKSIDAIKPKTSQNFYFSNQVSRDKTKKSMATNDYSYDYKIVKPRNSSVVPFDKLHSKQEKKQKNNMYSYTHYDFDGYVWCGKSAVYPNTKVSVINYKKERGRYS